MTALAAVRAAPLRGAGLWFGAKPQHLPGFCCGLAPIDAPPTPDALATPPGQTTGATQPSVGSMIVMPATSARSKPGSRSAASARETVRSTSRSGRRAPEATRASSAG